MFGWAPVGSEPRSCGRRLALWATLVLISLLPVAGHAMRGDDTIVQARDALRAKDKGRLAAARAAVMAVPADERHPLAMWVEYWELGNRLADAQQAELDAFYARWPGTYVEDRLRNDWLLELGKRGDWVNFTREFPRFRMNDDREVTCYAMLTEHLAGRAVAEAALNAWLAQRDADDGCALMSRTLFEAGVLKRADVWRRARQAIDAGRTRAARQAVELFDTRVVKAFEEVLKNPARYLAHRASAAGRTQAELATLALMRMASNDVDAAAAMLDPRWQRTLPPDLAGWAWASLGRQAAFKQDPLASQYFANARRFAGESSRDWSEDMRAWSVRAALRAETNRWPQVLEAIGTMTDAEQRDTTWMYWKAYALKAGAADGIAGSEQRAAGHALLMELSDGLSHGQMHFYGKLAAEDLGEPILLPPAPASLSAFERDAAQRNPGLSRALHLIAIDLRDEGVREWNFTLRGMNDRELLAAADLACQHEVWDRCINTSDRTRSEVDMAQRFPMPMRDDVVRHARAIGVDPAYVYGLIRQESRFIMDARSYAGASGLMQIMPSTARWTARKIGLAYSPAMISDRDVNLKLGTSYLKLVLDSFEGSQALAAAAYNAGPTRSRRWRSGPEVDAAIWAENIPFSETRDYVKKVLSNTTYYAALMSGEVPSLRARLGRAIGPRDPATPDVNEDLP